MGSKFLSGVYVSGVNDSRHRPKFYESLGMWQGTVNIQLPAETDERWILPCQRVTGRDPIDFEAKQDFLVRRCRLKGVAGYQVLPIDKTTGAPRGHHASKRIEITLVRRIDLEQGEELEVELEGFEV
jgi:hypothetical protein